MALFAVAMPTEASAQLGYAAGLPAGLPPAAEILNTPTAPLPGLVAPQQPQVQTPLPGFQQQPPSAAQPVAPPTPPLIITPSISIGEEYNDNIYQSSQKRWDLITVISPEIAIHGEQRRISVNLNYAPSLDLYARTSSANGFNQNLSADVTATLVPDTFFVAARAIGAVVPTSGTLGGLGGIGGVGAVGIPTTLGTQLAPSTGVLAKQNRTQYFAFSITPYVVHAFGTFGTAKAGLSLTQSDQFVSGGQTNPIPGTFNLQSQNSLTGEATAQFQTGEDFGRVRDLVVLDAQRSSGTGVLAGAQSNLVTNWFGYALNRLVIPFGELGYEDLKYNTIPRTHIQDAIWEIGVQLTPNPDSLISIGYGHHEGVTGFDVHGYYAITARTQISVNYSTQISSDLSQIQGVLGLTSFDQSGTAINSLTGAPLFLGTGLLAVQNGLYQSRYFAITGTTTLDRDVFAVTFQHQSQTPIAAAPGVTGAVFAQSGSGILGSWTHDVSERTRLTTSVGYARTSYQTTPSGNEGLFGTSLLVSHALSQTLSASVQYALFDQTSNFPGRTFTENIVLVALTKRF